MREIAAVREMADKLARESWSFGLLLVPVLVVVRVTGMGPSCRERGRPHETGGVELCLCARQCKKSR